MNENMYNMFESREIFSSWLYETYNIHTSYLYETEWRHYDNNIQYSTYIYTTTSEN